MQILLRVKFYDARAMQERHWMGLSNFGRKKAGKLELGLGCQILEAGKLGDAPENLNFWRIYGIIKVAYYRTGAK